MSRNTAVAVIVVLILVAGGYLLMRPQTTTNPTPDAKSTPAPTASSATEGAMMEEKEENMVTISSSGFSPKDITIKAGEAVTWTNSDSADHAVNSAPHPTHTIYPSLNLNTIKSGEKKSLTFPDAGTYKYHDHLNPTLFGSVTVE